MNLFGLPSRAAFEALPLEVRIRLVASTLLGWRYPADRETPRVPQRPPWMPTDVRLALGPRDEVIDCSTQTSTLLLGAYPGAPWDRESYGDLQIFRGRSAWSPLDAVARAGVGEVRAPVRGRCHLLQSWRDPVRLLGGHSRIGLDEGDDGVLILESTSRDDNRDGVRDGPRWTRTTWADIPGETRTAVLRG